MGIRSPSTHATHVNGETSPYRENITYKQSLRRGTSQKPNSNIESEKRP